MNVDLLVTNIGQLITCASPSGPKRGGEMRDVGSMTGAAVAVVDGKFVAVRESEVDNAEVVIDAEGRVVCPGFVDPHTHIVYGGDRLDEFELKIQGVEYLEILAAGGGIISTVLHTREATIDELVESGLTRLDKMLAAGTTTSEIKTGYGLDTETELKMLSVIEVLDDRHVIDIVPTFLPAHAVPQEFKDASDSFVDLICEKMLPQAWSWYEASHFHSRVPFFVDVFCERNAFNLEQARRVLETGARLGFKLKAHSDEFTNLGCSRLAVDLGATSIDHLDAISDEEVRLLAGSNTLGVVTPAVNFNFGSCEFADARKLIDAGCGVALSTDYNPGSAPSPAQPMSMAIACRYQKLLPSEAFNAATINAAHAVGLGDSIGSIEIGKYADLLILDCEDYRLAANEFGGNLVRSVFKKGKVVYESK
ncbi:MAG TPA: imidazolonepropionase [Pyrinomonadaceae bacterium]|nr:imidazolonepropionase [Pyrinomonadaceae bacterium]